MAGDTDAALPEDLERVVAFHGHLCPGVLIGYRAAKAGLAALGAVRAEDEELIAIVENDSCAADAVQVLAGCTFGKGNLFFRDYGKQVFTFAVRPSGRAVRVSLRHDAARGGEEADLPEAERRARRVRLLLEAPDDVLLKVEHCRVDLPETARLHASVLCEACGEKVMETRVRRVAGRTLCIPCAEKGTTSAVPAQKRGDDPREPERA